jgi:hypothetical protein
VTHPSYALAWDGWPFVYNARAARSRPNICAESVADSFKESWHEEAIVTRCASIPGLQTAGTKTRIPWLQTAEMKSCDRWQQEARSQGNGGRADVKTACATSHRQQNAQTDKLEHICRYMYDGVSDVSWIRETTDIASSQENLDLRNPGQQKNKKQSKYMFSQPASRHCSTAPIFRA